jgi:hypothetical protein
VSAELDDFVDRLCELELDPDELRRDPEGRAWLPKPMREQVASDPAYARALDEFVQMELALHDVHEPCDAFFTRSVMNQLPELEAVDDRRRTWILASAYALAIGVAYVLIGPLLGSGEINGWFEPLHDWYREHAVEAGGMWMTVALLLTAAALVVVPTGNRSTTA